MYKIRLTGLSGIGFHGVLAEERNTGQTFVVDLELSVDRDAGALADDIDQTVHYGILAKQVNARICGGPVNLIETLADDIANLCLGFAAVRQAVVTVHKPQAPITVPFNDVSVTVVKDA